MLGFKKKTMTTATDTSNMHCTATTVGSKPLLWAGFKKDKSSYLYYRYAPHNDVMVNDGPYIWWWFHKITRL